MDAAAQVFFLDPVKGDELVFRPPAREGVTMSPLIDGRATFVAIEEAIAAATSTVHICAWIFNDLMRVQSSVVRRGGIANWADLLVTTARRGVQIRLLLSDFDPVLSTPNHQLAWSTYRRLFRHAQKLAPSERERLQVYCSRHSATISVGIEHIVKPELENRIKALNAAARSAGFERAREQFATLPGLWRNVRPDVKKGIFAMVTEPEWTIFPASHHQKLCIIDSKVGFVGGLDVNDGRLDSPSHTGMLWHDVHCQVEGSLVTDLELNMIGRWNSEVHAFQQFLEVANAQHSDFRIPHHTVTTISDRPAMAKASGSGVAQMHRTVTQDATFSITPTVLRADIEELYERAISHAQHFVYIETQYFRSSQAADWLIQRRQAVPGLQVIVVLPVAPEEVSRSGGADRLTLHGLALQSQALTKLQGAFGSNFGVFSMVARGRAKQSRATNRHGSFQIYVHSKCMIVDDVFSTIGSANVNPRSFRTDTELNASWHDPVSARALRVRLWTELLGSSTPFAEWKMSDFVRQWTRIATRNVRASVDARTGFIVPHDVHWFPGTLDDDMPNEFAELREDGTMAGPLSEVPV